MKTLKTITAALLIAFSFSSFAADGTAKEKLEMNYALKTYISAVAEGKIAALPEVLDNGVKFSSSRGEKIVSHNKAEMLNALKASENVKQNCSTSYTIVEGTPTFSVVKVTMKYDTFSKVSYLNLSNTGKGWKITSVSTSFI
ncbi:nuclear transport factor 2 family protein [Daejeonella lutea]|uniref:Putative lumazine-binding n=1 Tax=Daejeonella lutea TaxID=572036 RepID=A0A1T5A9J6_9SPHI|nr:nuclear transport factor 2 family protein [Daejeonella lutea]SKB31608.1 Putative lumazine-binding [Daejeonella lutea]